MITQHRIHFQDARQMKSLSTGTVDLVVTSPPYPMIAMWDKLFIGQNPDIEPVLQNGDGPKAFELMHRQLDAVWQELWRILKPGGIVCLNVGDAARTIHDRFRLYPNHARMLNQFLTLGFQALPAILWRKQTNAPNKFMGSGMLPSGAYVTLEHEYILILRKGPKREFKTSDTKRIRRESALFWEERNIWYSDVWLDVKGTTQKLDNTGSRLRSGAFPFEVPYRLINMYSVKGDTVLDPFLGTGTTMRAAMTAARNSIGFEIDQRFKNDIRSKAGDIVALSNEIIDRRIDNHLEFIHKRHQTRGEPKYKNKHYHFPVVTRQEIELLLNPVVKVDLDKDGERFVIDYASKPHMIVDEK